MTDKQQIQALGKLANEVAEVIRITVEAIKPFVEKGKRNKRVVYLATYGRKPRTRKKNRNRLMKIFGGGDQ